MEGVASVTESCAGRAFDRVILTGSNEKQAHGYGAQLAWRQRNGLLDPAAVFEAVPDPGGRRVGSAGATLAVLATVAERICASNPRIKSNRLADLFRNRRMLILHSGGDSRRVPAYAAQGKIFAPLPATVDGTNGADLFDLCLRNMGMLPARSGGQVLIGVGDVLLTFDGGSLSFDRTGVTGVAYPGPLSVGGRHGVYVGAAPGTAGKCVRVRDFLQKPDEDVARTRGAVDPMGRVLVDTGILSLDPETVGKILELAGVRLSEGRVSIGTGLLRNILDGRCPALDLYEEFALALAPAIRLKAYLSALHRKIADKTHEATLVSLYNGLRKIAFHVNIVPYCDFFHVGTSRELLSNISTLSRTAKKYGFENFSREYHSPEAMLDDAFVFNSSTYSSRVIAERGSMIEASHINGPVRLRGSNMLVGLPGSARTPIVLNEEICLVCLPIGNSDWVSVLYGLDDDFKGRVGAGTGCSFLNTPIERWLARHKLSQSAIWSRSAEKTLWEARMWVAGGIDASLNRVLWMQPGVGSRQKNAWLRSRRLSMAQVVRRVNQARLIAHRQEIQRMVSIDALATRLRTQHSTPASLIVEQIRTREEATRAVLQIGKAVAGSTDPLFKARAFQLAAMIATKRKPTAAALRAVGCRHEKDLRTGVFDAVRESVYRGGGAATVSGEAAIEHDQVVWVTTPVRIDFAGGWSDTPPICSESGGAVLNAAVTLNGQYPVQVMAKLNDRRVVRLSSIDLGCTMELTRTSDFLQYGDPRHWASLPIAALSLSGIGPNGPGQSLSKCLSRLGGGLDLTVFSALPKGSGLGTSSILGAAVLACLGRVTGRMLNTNELVSLTSVLEQRMNTGGGWQDQIGGIVPGVKLIQTNPGPDQTPSLQWVVFDMSADSELRSRVLLYYTGQKRMARDILHNVVARYLARDPAIVQTVQELKRTAIEMKTSLDSRDLDSFASIVDRYWMLKKHIDPAATNAGIESILNSVGRWTAGRVLAGAGGGGFLLLIGKDHEATRRIRRTLETRRVNQAARFFDFDVNLDGLTVTVL